MKHIIINKVYIETKREFTEKESISKGFDKRVIFFDLIRKDQYTTRFFLLRFFTELLEHVYSFSL